MAWYDFYVIRLIIGGSNVSSEAENKNKMLNNLVNNLSFVIIFFLNPIRIIRRIDCTGSNFYLSKYLGFTIFFIKAFGQPEPELLVGQVRYSVPKRIVLRLKIVQKILTSIKIGL